MVLKLAGNGRVGRPEGDVGYLWMSVADEVERLIRSGELPENAPLPNERLAEDMEVSPGTVRRAAKELRERGLVATFRSKGTYVASQAEWRCQEW